jgi:hypothetical protein
MHTFPMSLLCACLCARCFTQETPDKSPVCSFRFGNPGLEMSTYVPTGASGWKGGCVDTIRTCSQMSALPHQGSPNSPMGAPGSIE